MLCCIKQHRCVSLCTNQSHFDMNTKALFLDIDGTLVMMHTHHIPESTIEALKIAKSNGLFIFIATGRPASLIINLGPLQALNLIDGYITMNGAVCMINNQVIHQNLISPATVDHVLTYCEENNICCPIFTEKGVVVYNPSPIFEEVYYTNLNIPHLRSCTLEEGKALNVLQLCPFIDEAHEQKLKQTLADPCEYNRWHPAFIDLGASGSLKSKGIDIVAQHVGFDLSQTMAIGDGGNDISMLKHAQIGVAMGNASDKVKAAADYVTTAIDEDGIQHALQHFAII